MCELFVRRLADMILSGELRVGEHLPPERQLAEQMGVSKSVARSGLAELARIGLVTIKPQSGTYVADYMVTGNLETFNAIVRFNGNHLDADTVAAIFDFRLAVEGFALRRLAKCWTQADVAALRADIERIGDDIASGAMTYTGLAERFQQFHLRICQCSRSAMLPLTMNAVREGAIASGTVSAHCRTGVCGESADAVCRCDRTAGRRCCLCAAEAGAGSAAGLLSGIDKTGRLTFA